MKTKLVLILGLLSMQPLFGGGLTSVERTNLLNAAKSTDPNAIQGVLNSVASKLPFNNPKTQTMDQNAYDAAKAQMDTLTGGGAVTPPVPTRPAKPAPTPSAPAVPTRPAKPSQPSQTTQDVKTMKEFGDARAAAQGVRQAMNAAGYSPAEIDTAMNAIVAR